MPENRTTSPRQRLNELLADVATGVRLIGHSLAVLYFARAGRIAATLIKLAWISTDGEFRLAPVRLGGAFRAQRSHAVARLKACCALIAWRCAMARHAITSTAAGIRDRFTHST